MLDVYNDYCVLLGYWSQPPLCVLEGPLIVFVICCLPPELYFLLSPYNPTHVIPLYGHVVHHVTFICSVVAAPSLADYSTLVILLSRDVVYVHMAGMYNQDRTREISGA